MKKLLSVLATVGVVASSSTSVVACGTKSNSKPEESKDYLNEIIRDFQKEVTEIYDNHMKSEVIENLIGVQEIEKDYLFIKKENIKTFSNKEKEITLENKKQIETDENLILKSKLLEEKINELKKVNKYKVILEEVDSIFDRLEVIYNNNFKIKSGELSQGVYIGNFINEYKVKIKYKGKSDIEKFEIRDTLKYTSTDSKIFKIAADNLSKNIEKDFLVSSEMKKNSNFEWQSIRQDKNSYEGYGEFSKEIKDFVNSSDEYKNILVNFIKNNYFKNFEIFKDLKFKFNKENFYISENFTTNFLNVFESKGAKSFANYTERDSSELFFKTIFRNDPDSELNIKNLELYFRYYFPVWSEELFKLKTSYLKEYLKLTTQQIDLVEKTNEFIKADSIGNIKLNGAKIEIGSGSKKYIHELPNFRLSVTYNVSTKKEDKINFLSEFTSKILIKSMHKFYGIDTKYKYPDFNSDQDYLMNIGNKEIILEIKEKLRVKSSSYSGDLNPVFWSLWNNISVSNTLKFINNLKISNLLRKSNKWIFLINSNYSENLVDIKTSNEATKYYNKIDYELQEVWLGSGISFNWTEKGDKNPDTITFKLGYLAVNIKYEFLFNYIGANWKWFIRFM